MQVSAAGPGAGISAAEFAALLERPDLGLPRGCRPAIACSGGADSLALAVLTGEWCRARGLAPLALIVDHGLREGSAAEAERTRIRLSELGIPARILPWLGAKPASNLQAAARAARYRLLAEACRAGGIGHLLLAHHADDQAETLLLRLGRGSGVDGLSCMAPVTELETGGLRLLRPLLDQPKSRLLATLEERGLPWEEDPSNQNAAFARVRMRRLMPVLAAEGLGRERLSATARRMRRARTALEHYSADLLGRAARFDAAGFAWFDPAALLAAPEEIGLRALVRLLTIVGGADRPPRIERLEGLYGALNRGQIGRGRTIMGCRVAPWGNGLAILREARALAPDLAREAAGRLDNVWDRRFHIRWPDAAPAGLAAGALGRLYASLPREARERARRLPPAVRPTLPALKGLEGILAVPHLNYCKAPEFLSFSADFSVPAGLESCVGPMAHPL